VNRGAVIDTKDNKEQTPLDIAILHNCNNVKQLLQGMVDPSTINENEKDEEEEA